MLKISGDTDGVVSTYGTKQWIKELDWRVTQQWRPYYVSKQGVDSNDDLQVAGYIEERDGMTFATVHGAGHAVPKYKP